MLPTAEPAELLELSIHYQEMKENGLYLWDKAASTYFPWNYLFMA